MRKRMYVYRALIVLILTALIGGCCTPPSQPPQPMVAGLIGHITKCKFLPALQQRGVKNVKCALGRINMEESQYRFGDALHAMCQDLFETEVWDGGQQVAAKEAINAILRSTGISDTSQLWDPPILEQFMKKIQQTGGISVVDYLLLVNITGVSPSLQAQAKIVCTTPGPDWGQQIPVRLEMNWKTTYCNLEGEHTGGEWQQQIESELGCSSYSPPPEPADTSGGGTPSTGNTAAPPNTPSPPIVADPQGNDVLQDLENSFIPQLLDIGGPVAVFPALWENAEGEWVAKALSEEIAAGLSKLLRRKSIQSYSGAKLVSALESRANRSFFHYCRPEDAGSLGFRLFDVAGTIGGEITLVKPNAFSNAVGIRLWCLNTFGEEVAAFEYTYSPNARINGQTVMRRFEFKAVRGVCGRADPFQIDIDREIAYAADDMIGAMAQAGLLPENRQIHPHASGYLKINQKGITLDQERLIAVVGASEFTSQGENRLNPSPKLVTWMTNRLGLLNLRFSTLLDAEIAGFIRSNVKLFQEDPGRIDEQALQKLVGEGKPVPDTMVMVKIRNPLVKGKGKTLSVSWRDVTNGTVIAWYEYPLPEIMNSTVSLGTPTVFNTMLQGNGLVFIIDTSGSMNASLPGSTTTRLEYTQSELIRLIDSLTPSHYFTILAFSDAVLSWSTAGLVQATDQAKEDAKKFIAGLKPNGGTNARDALGKALKLQGAETICFLSDGQPNNGPANVLQHVSQIIPQGVTINTFAFEGANRQFMKQLARNNGGVYVTI